MTPRQYDACLRRYVGLGGNAETGRALLAEAVRSHTGDNLASALVHHGFASEATAQKLVASC